MSVEENSSFKTELSTIFLLLEQHSGNTCSEQHIIQAMYVVSS